MNVKYDVIATVDDTPVRGNASAIGDDYDRDVEDEILRRLARGDVWAWASVEVQASIEYMGYIWTGSDYLGSCSYENESAFCQPGGYFDDMKRRALDELIQDLDTSVDRGEAAKKARTALLTALTSPL